MGKIKVTPCGIKGLYVIEPTVFKDERGYFVETYNQNDFKEAGLDMTFVQAIEKAETEHDFLGRHLVPSKNIASEKSVHITRKA